VDIPIGEFKGLGRFFYVVYPLGFALRATTQHVGKAGGLQILRCKGIAVKRLQLHPLRLDSEALRLLQC
jgi:hypothetical protein